jgi:hypothetical protein
MTSSSEPRPHDLGVPPSGSGHPSKTEPSCTVSAQSVGVPNAARLRQYLVQVSDMLNVVRAEWGESWTEWAQGIQDETRALQVALENDE